MESILSLDKIFLFLGELLAISILVISAIMLDFQTCVSTKWSRKALKEAQAQGDTEAVEKTKSFVCAHVIAPNRAHLSACKSAQS